VRDGRGSEPGAGIDLAWNGQAFLGLDRPGMDLFRKQAAWLRAYRDQRGERAPEILSQLGFPIDYFASILGLNGPRNPYTVELITITQVLTSHVTMVAKHHLACRRPDRLGVAVMPMIPTPAHGAFPSGHAAEAFAVATVLEAVVDAVEGHYPSPGALKKLLLKQAERIAVNRTVAGVHFPIDSWAGAALGEAVGQIVLGLCGAPGAGLTPRRYAAVDCDFQVGAFRPDPWDAPADGPRAAGLDRSDGRIDVQASDLFAWLWRKATAEFALDEPRAGDR
jgi:membrane-associated phospholipid phosphatase